MTFRLEKARHLPCARHHSLLSEVFGVVPRAAIRSERLFVGLAFLLMAALSPGLRAQSRVFPQWTQRFDAAHLADAPHAIATDAQGNSYVTGSITAGSATNPEQESAHREV